MGPLDAIDLTRVKRALVIKLRHHGDVLLSTPVFSVLSNNVANIEIDALIYADTRDMLEGNPAISRVFVVDRKWKSQAISARASSEWRLLCSLRERRYDLLIHLSEHPRGAWLARTMGSSFSVAPDYAMRSKFWRNSFTHRFALPKNAHRHMVEWNLDALRRIGIQPASAERKLVLVAGAQGEAEAVKLLESHHIETGAFVHIHPASRWSFKCWSEARNAALIDTLIQNGERVVLTSAPDVQEMAFVERILSHCRTEPVNLAGKLTLKGLAALTARAKLFIGVDSAPMHMACAMETPVVALFGPSGEREWGPWSSTSRVVASAVHPCRPCGIDGCGGGKISDCLVTLPERQVLRAVRDLLGQ